MDIYEVWKTPLYDGNASAYIGPAQIGASFTVIGMPDINKDAILELLGFRVFDDNGVRIQRGTDFQYHVYFAEAHPTDSNPHGVLICDNQESDWRFAKGAFGIIVTQDTSIGRQQINYHPCMVDAVLDESKLVRRLGRVLRFNVREEAQTEADRLHTAFYANWQDEE